MTAPKDARLAEFWQRLQHAPRASTADEAYQQISDILNDVEDQHTDIPYDPENWQTDGRMYPPLRDNVHKVEGHPKVKRYRSRQHNTFIAENGAIEIQRTDGAVEFTKPGADGQGIWEVQ